MGDMSKEPSMEEILSSIKRIIAEEGDETSAPRGLRRGRLEVVTSDEVAEAETPAAEIIEIESEAAAPEASDESDDILELTPPAEIEAEAPALEEASVSSADDWVEADAVLEEEAPLELTPPMEDVVAETAPEAEQAETEMAETSDNDVFELVDDGAADIALPETDVVEIGAPDDAVADETAEVLEAAPEAAAVEEAEAPAAEVLELTKEIDTEEKVTLSNAAVADSMISVESEVAARHSLSALSSMIVVPETEGNTLEDVVKAMLKPMLKEWLDAKLPELVEGMVAKEIARITGGR
jgi:cell pole-organizing protein PopZ